MLIFWNFGSSQFAWLVRVRAGRHISAQTTNIHPNSGKSQLLKIKVSGWLNPSGLPDSFLKDPHQQHTIVGREMVKQSLVEKRLNKTALEPGGGGGSGEGAGKRWWGASLSEPVSDLWVSNPRHDLCKVGALRFPNESVSVYKTKTTYGPTFTLPTQPTRVPFSR